jgi:septum formation protein
MTTTRKLVLATRSLSRAAQLAGVGFTFEQVDPPFEDPDQPGQSLAPELEARALAGQKALSVYEMTAGGGVVLSADTIVINADNKHVGKPTDADDARSMLEALIVKPHRILTGVAILVADQMLFAHEEAVIEMAPPSPEAFDEYIASGEWVGAAGGYRLDDLKELGWRTAASLDPVGGLPIARVTSMLAELGVYPDG